MNKNQPIGIFDSGLGGLTVLKALQEKLPNESFVYIGDTAHVPYGNKSQKAIINYTKTLSNFLIEDHNVKMIIVACNTASSIALKSLQRAYKIPIIDVINPIQDLLLENNQIKRIGIIGTHNTVKSKAYNKLLLSINPKLKIFSQACPLFVPIIEEGLENHQITKIISGEYLYPLIYKKIEALILGCTHYPILKKNIKSFLPASIKIFDSAETLSIHTKKYLINNSLISSSSNHVTHLFITDESDHFNQFACHLLNNQFSTISSIQLF